jgi:hypothetical protein
MRFFLRVPLILACLAPVGCSIQTQGQVDSAVDVEPTLYYYGGPHFYPESLGGDWCPIAEAHAHDFPPDHPEFYAYDSGYYYYSGRPNEAYVVGTVPIGVRIHEAREHEPHRVYALPAQAPPAPHLANGRWPTREAHPAPLRPPPPQFNGGRRSEPRVGDGHNQNNVDPRRVEDHRAVGDDHRSDRHPDDHHDDHPAQPAQPTGADHRFQEPGRAGEEHRVDARQQPQMQQPQAQQPQMQQPQARPAPNESHRAPPPSTKRKKDDKK